MITLPIALSCLILADGQHLTASASMAAGELVILRKVSNFTVTLDASPSHAEKFGWMLAEVDTSISRPHPLVQLDIPDSVELIAQPMGDLVTPEDFAAFYVDGPFGRPAFRREVEVAFRLLRTPSPTETIGINITAYLGEGEDCTFERIRLELPLISGAASKVGDSKLTRWGRRNRYAIGDRLADVVLPCLEGDFRPDDLMGGNGALITTYRAHW